MIARVTLFLCLSLSTLLLPHQLSAEIIEHRGVSFYIYRVDPDKDKLELFLSEGKGKPNTFLKVRDRVQKRGQQLKFAMNSGIFEGTFLPTGLHISEGRTITKVNVETFVPEREGQFTPNFFLKPNGIFYLTPDGRAAIRETSEYVKVQIKPRAVLATQSGPLLVQRGKIHPVLTADSTSTRLRNGVGVTEDGQIIFACSVLDQEIGRSNLYNTAELFRDRLGCPNALYLDGDISYVYIRGVTPPIKETNWFAGIFAITEPAP